MGSAAGQLQQEAMRLAAALVILNAAAAASLCLLLLLGPASASRPPPLFSSSSMVRVFAPSSPSFPHLKLLVDSDAACAGWWHEGRGRGEGSAGVEPAELPQQVLRVQPVRRGAGTLPLGAVRAGHDGARRRRRCRGSPGRAAAAARDAL